VRLTLLVAAALAIACSRAPTPSQETVDASGVGRAGISAPSANRADAKPFGEACVADTECAGGVCFHKRLKGPDTGPERRDAGFEPVEHDGYCSIKCDTDNDCPVPPTRGKCGARGMCKRPD
jgi:hypothetical protein